MVMRSEPASENQFNSQSQGGSKLNPLHKTLFEKVKKGLLDEVRQLITESNVDVRCVIDEPKNFSQTLIFSACVVPDHQKAVAMVKMLTSMGVDGAKEDSLKQTPIFYASREGKNEVIEYLVNTCKDYVNRQDKYG